MREQRRHSIRHWLAVRAQGRALSVAAMALLGLATGHAAVAATPAGEAPAFGEVVDVQLVVVEAVVLDERGKPVLDLQPGDFALFEDEKPMTLEHVELVGASASGDRATGSPGATAATADMPPLHLAIFLDEVHVGAASRMRILRQMAEVLGKSLRPSDRVMLAVYDGGTRVVLPFSTDRKALATALAEVETVSLGRLNAEHDWRWTLDQLYEDAQGHHGVSPCSNIQEFVQTYQQQQHDQVERAIDAVGRFVDSLAGIVGRKAVLHVSDGIPTRPGAEASEYALELCRGGGANEGQPQATEAFRHDVYMPDHRALDAGAYDTTGRWEEVAARANAGNVSIYTFQAGPSAELATIEYPHSRPTMGGEASHKANLQESLFVVADRSGGRASFDGADLERELASTVGELQSYYLLTYTPPAAATAGVRHVRLAVARPGSTVRYRKLYRPRTAHEQVADGLLGRLLYGSGREASPLRLELASRQPAADDKVKARFRLAIPVELLQLPESGGRREGRFTAFAAVADSRGVTSPVRETAVPVRVAPAGADAPKQFLWEVEMLLRPGEHDVGVAVRDELSGETTFVVRRFELRGR